MSIEQKDESWLSQINGPVAIGGIAVLLAFTPTFTGGGISPLYLLVGVLLIVGGLILNAIRPRP